MAITRLKSFAGEAEVLGKLVEFAYETPDGNEPYLIIHGLSLLDAEMALAQLGTGGVVGVRPPAMLTPVGATGSREKPEPPPPPVSKTKPATSALDKEKIDKPPEAKGEAKATVAESKTPKAETKAPAGETKAPVAETKPAAAEKTVESTPPATNGAAGATTAAVNDSDPDAVFLKASKMRDILYALQDRGIVEEAAMVVECEKLKAKVPLLSKIPNLPDRVKRTLEVMKTGVSA